MNHKHIYLSTTKYIYMYLYEFNQNPSIFPCNFSSILQKQAMSHLHVNKLAITFSVCYILLTWKIVFGIYYSRIITMELNDFPQLMTVFFF